MGITQDFTAKVQKALKEWHEGRAASVVLEDIDEAFNIFISKVPYKTRKPKAAKKRPCKHCGGYMGCTGGPACPGAY